jgi:hypothetical protein
MRKVYMIVAITDLLDEQNNPYTDTSLLPEEGFFTSHEKAWNYALALNDKVKAEWDQYTAKELGNLRAKRAAGDHGMFDIMDWSEWKLAGMYPTYIVRQVDKRRGRR